MLFSTDILLDISETRLLDELIILDQRLDRLDIDDAVFHRQLLLTARR